MACGLVAESRKGGEHFSNAVHALKGTDKWAVPPPRSTQHAAQHQLMALGLGLAHRPTKFSRTSEPDFPISFPAGHQEFGSCYGSRGCKRSCGEIPGASAVVI